MIYGFRRILLGFFVGSFIALPVAGVRCKADEEAFDPYLVYVDQEGVTARCGPGGEYYRTDPLRHGQRLEVYLETADGWLGIRPPEGSFCWVPADSVRLERGESIGRITEEATLAWIGTHLGKARKYLWQIQLPRGEEVAILGRAEREGPDGPQLWYRIVPPSGEFRWVHRDQVVDNPELLVRDKPRGTDQLASGLPTPVDEEIAERAQRPRGPQRPLATTSVLDANSLADGTDEPNRGAPVKLYPFEATDAVPLTIAAAPRAAMQDGSGLAIAAAVDEAPTSDIDPAAKYASPLSPLAQDQPIGSGVAQPRHPPLMAIASQPQVQNIGASHVEPVVASGDAGWVRGNSRSAPIGVQPPPHATDLQGRVRQVDHQVAQSSSPPVSGAALGAEASVDALQLELTRRMVASARAAEFEPLRIAAEQIARSHRSESERQRAGLLAQRIEQVQSVARRRDGEIERPAVTPSLAATSAGSVPSSSMPSAAGADAAGEVAGYLVQVYSARPDSPPFALTDAAGRTTHYVSPSPGVNLRRYLNQHITVAGQAGYETGLDTPHIIATGAVRSPELR